VVLLSLRAQLKAPASNTRPISSMCLNLEGCSGSAARCVSLDWVPGSAGTAFVAAHRDGTVLLYHKASKGAGTGWNHRVDSVVCRACPCGSVRHMLPPTSTVGGSLRCHRFGAFPSFHISTHANPALPLSPLLCWFAELQVVGSSSDTKLLARSSSSHALRPPVTQLQGPGGGGGGVSAAAVSPDGLHVAAACKDGVLRVYALPGGGLVGGCKVS
jgi:WD40 repeat protein